MTFVWDDDKLYLDGIDVSTISDPDSYPYRVATIIESYQGIEELRKNINHEGFYTRVFVIFGSLVSIAGIAKFGKNYVDTAISEERYLSAFFGVATTTAAIYGISKVIKISYLEAATIRLANHNAERLIKALNIQLIFAVESVNENPDSFPMSTSLVGEVIDIPYDEEDEDDTYHWGFVEDLGV